MYLILLRGYVRDIHGVKRLNLVAKQSSRLPTCNFSTTQLSWSWKWNWKRLSNTNTNLPWFCRNNNVPPIEGAKRMVSSSKKLPFEVDTNVAKDVLLYSYENPKFYKLLGIFAVVQFVFWMHLATFTYGTLRDSPPINDPDPDDPQLPFWKKINLGQNKYRNGITALCLSLGYVILLSSWMFTKRSVRFLYLVKGGEKVKIITYGPFARPRKPIVVPLNDMNCSQSQQHVRVYLPIQVRGYWMYFLLDKQGTFTNTQLFDYTAGLKRTWK